MNKRYLALDLGLARTGVALSDAMGIIASSLGHIKNSCDEDLFNALDTIIKDNDVGTIVIGYPKNMNGTVGERGENSKRISGIIKVRYNVKTILWDERLTTVSAHRILSEGNVRGKKRKNTVDGLSAVLILQGYLDSL